MTGFFDWVIVGAGFTGATLARQLAEQRGQRVLLIDRRNHVGGNAYDYFDEQGVLVHKYGPHIFHTNSERIFHYLGRFTEWRPYQHHVRALIDGKQVPLPFNLNTIHALFPQRLAERLEERLLEQFGFGSKVPILQLRQCEDADLRFLADYVYDNVFKHYTRKQWDLSPEELSPGVTARVPVVVSRDDRYFQDRFQAMPRAGYTRMFERMLDHPKIQLMLQADFNDVRDGLDAASRIVFCGPIDEFFAYRHGPLPYRSLRFENRAASAVEAQAVGTVNYPNNNDFTRITDMALLTGQQIGHTVLTAEYPQAYHPGTNEPYYPVPCDSSQRIFRRYQEEADKVAGRIWFAGRLGDYQYYNMDQAVGRAMALFDTLDVRQTMTVAVS